MHGSILLDKWIKENGLRAEYVCKKLGISYPTLRRYRDGGVVPSTKWDQIERLTDGAVPADSWK